MEVEDKLFEVIEKKYSASGKENGTSYEVEIMKALQNLFPEVYDDGIPGYVANLTCELDLPDNEIEAVKTLESVDPDKYGSFCGFLADKLSQLDVNQLEVLAK